MDKILQSDILAILPKNLSIPAGNINTYIMGKNFKAPTDHKELINFFSLELV